MELVPAHCRNCGRFFLESPVVVAADNVLCECGGIARVLGGDRYGGGDEALFDAIATSLETAGVSWMIAPQLARALDGRENQAPGVALAKLTQLAPTLSVIKLIAADDPRMARKAESMLATLLDAMAASRSRSGVAPRLATTPEEAKGSGLEGAEYASNGLGPGARDFNGEH